MTVVPVDSRRPAARHARPPLRRKIRSVVSVKIPKAVNASIDWASRNRLMAACLMVAVASAVAEIIFAGVWLPAVLCLAGAIVGAATVRIADDGLVEENRRLAAENQRLTLKAVTPEDPAADELTRKLPRIPEDDR